MTIEQLNRTKLDAQCFRIYVALLCEQDMTINKLASKTAITWKTIRKKLLKLEAKGLVTRTNNKSKVQTYSGIDPTMENNPTVVENDRSEVRENDLPVVEKDLGGMENDPTMKEIIEKYS
jgi:predicted transcriptional regulator|tara:strand:+ start:3894 stop:4253 length:360 start_codon:yes stop_codon:yes gene_type:complete